mgnify:CR=1 FL=1
MPKTNSPKKPVRSFRLSQEGIYQLQTIAPTMGRRERDVIEVALDRMYREEVRFRRVGIRDGEKPEDGYMVDNNEKGTT